VKPRSGSSPPSSWSGPPSPASSTRSSQGCASAAGEIAPELARGPSAPGCRSSVRPELGHGGARSGPDCFTTSSRRWGRPRESSGASSGSAPTDADDIAMEALLKTCMRRAAADDLRAYFFAVVRNMGRKAVGSMRRTMAVTTSTSATPPPTCSSQRPSTRVRAFALAWRLHLLHAGDRRPGAAEPAVDGLGFRAESGERWEESGKGRKPLRVPQTAIKKLRRKLATVFASHFRRLPNSTVPITRNRGERLLTSARPTAHERPPMDLIAVNLPCLETLQLQCNSASPSSTTSRSADADRRSAWWS